VGLCLQRGPELAIGVLGILKAGAAYMPLDPVFPEDRLRYMLEDSAADVVITELALAGSFGDTSARVLCIDGDTALVAAPATPPAISARPRSRAYVIYTSGSTGRPKGVEIEHGALSNFLCSMARVPGLTERDVLLAVTTFSFDIAALELFLPLMCGACIELASRETAIDASALARLLETSKATVMQATPATWRMLLDGGWHGGRTLRAFCGGEALGRDLAERLLVCTAELWNLYGPTETTVWSSVAKIDDASKLSIGRPIANTQLYVLGPNQELLPVGVVGELWIGGSGVARGYLNREELTNERFVPNPFRAGRMYRTGDLARRLADGRFQCLGRIDDQVKIRGYRIELGEIETTLAEHPNIKECAVAARYVDGDTRLVTYFTGVATAAECREHLRRALPEYMVPGYFVQLSELPRTPNNKVDRKSLPTPQSAALAPDIEYSAPRNDKERVVAEIFAEVLSIQRVGVQHNFFELGGHSLLATRVMSRLRARFGVELPLRALFEAPTVAGLAAKVTAAGSTNAASSSPTPATDTLGPRPLAPAQERLWFVEQLQPERAASNVPVLARVRGPLEVASLRAALAALVRAHDALRTVFTVVEGTPAQLLHPVDPELVFVDLASLGRSAAELEWRTRLDRDMAAPFDVVSGPLFRFSLKRIDSAEHLLVLMFHH
jgi:amino acid adenylation domain-containing protein